MLPEIIVDEVLSRVDHLCRDDRLILKDRRTQLLNRLGPKDLLVLEEAGHKLIIPEVWFYVDDLLNTVDIKEWRSVRWRCMFRLTLILDDLADEESLGGVGKLWKSRRSESVSGKAVHFVLPPEYSYLSGTLEVLSGHVRVGDVDGAVVDPLIRSAVGQASTNILRKGHSDELQHYADRIRADAPFTSRLLIFLLEIVDEIGPTD